MAESSSKYEKVAIHDVTLMRSTDKAGLYKTADGDEHWIPFSQISDDSVDRDGDTGTLRIPRWLADEKGLDAEEE